MTGRRRDRLLLLVAGAAVGARLPAGQIASRFDAFVFVVLLAFAVFLLLLPPRRLSRREVAALLERLAEQDRGQEPRRRE